MFLGKNLQGTLYLPAIGPLANAEKYDCDVITTYDADECVGTVRIEKEFLVGEVRAVPTEITKSSREFAGKPTGHIHNPLGFARFKIPLYLPSYHDPKDEYREFWIYGKHVPKIEGFEKIDSQLASLYESLGYKVFGNYIARDEP